MRRGTFIVILVLLVVIGVFAALQIGGLTSDRRPPEPSPTASPSQ